MSSSNSANAGSALSLDAKQKEDLDIFLSTIESKLRGPFSSLDIAKSVQTMALRKGALTPKQYLQRVAQVISRTDKVVQLRILIGLLGLDPPKPKPPTLDNMNGNNYNNNDSEMKKDNDDDDQINSEIYKILQLGQDTKEEWVKTISGLTQGIMFCQQEDEANSRESCRGEHAQELLEKTSEEICQGLEQQVVQSSSSSSSSTTDTSSSTGDDLNASFAPYRYALVSNELLQPIIPECCNGRNPHFQTNTAAAILKMDEALDAQRAKEEQDHHQNNMATVTSSKSSGGGAASLVAAAKQNSMPGYRPANLVRKTSKKDPPKTNMFMTKKPGMAGGVPKSRLLQKTVLRRKGAAQSLVSKASMKARTMQGGGATGTGAATTARSRMGGSSLGSGGVGGGAAALKGRARAMANRSKMKMIDVQEVDELNKEHAKREQKDNDRSSKKRRILEAAAQRGLGSKKMKAEQAAAASAPAAAVKAENNNNNNGNTTAAPVKMETDAAAAAPPNTAVKMEEAPTPVATAPATVPDANFGDADTNGQQQQQQQQQSEQHQPEWQVLLQEKSNKLSEEDRMRVQHFFESNYNPTPDQPVYKMKLHEHRTNDQQTGQAIKETFYLELDYNTFTSKQSKKVKRY